MASRSLDDLHPELKPLAEAFLKKCEEHGIDVLVTCTWRSHIEQEALYSKGRSQPGRVVTNARGGQSKHNFMLEGKPASKAFDIVPVIGGKPEWDANHPAWVQAGEIGESLGLAWAGRWVKMREYPHFEMKT